MPASAVSGAAALVPAVGAVSTFAAGVAVVAVTPGAAGDVAGLSQAASASAAANVASAVTAEAGRAVRVGFIASPKGPPSWRNQSTGAGASRTGSRGDEVNCASATPASVIAAPAILAAE